MNTSREKMSHITDKKSKRKHEDNNLLEKDKIISKKTYTDQLRTVYLELERNSRRTIGEERTKQQLGVILNSIDYPIDDSDVYIDELVCEYVFENPTVIEEIKVEPLLDPRNKREALFPIQHPKIWEFYKKHQSSFWTADEIDLAKDIKDWRTRLNDDEKHFIKYQLAFFVGSDFLVNDNESKKAEEVTVLEYEFMLHDKMAREDVHSETYANMLEAYVEDPVEREHLKNAIKTIPIIKKKAQWFKKYINNGTFVEREVAGAITEGIAFSSAFCSIFWLKKQGKMPGLCDANELISRDEGLHRDFNCMSYRDYIVNKLTQDRVIQMIKEAVDIEIEFCTESIPVKLIGMNHDLMSQYVKYVADHLSIELINRTIYNVTNPFDWMTLMSIRNKTDFFAHRPNAYARQKAFTNKSENQIVFNEEY